MLPNADMVPKDLPIMHDVVHDVVHACLQRKETMNLYKCNISVITEIQFAIQTQVTKLYGTSTCGCNNNTIFQKEQFSRFLPSTYVGHVSQPWRCQSGTIAPLLNLLFAVFTISLLPNYRVKYYDYTVEPLLYDHPQNHIGVVV